MPRFAPIIAPLAVCCFTLTPAFGSVQEPGGPPVMTVAELVFEGVESVSEDRLREAVQTRQRPWLPWRRARPFDPQEFEADLRRIEEVYAEHGFPNARVVETDQIVHRQRQEVRLRIVIDEGEPVRLRSVEYAGFEVLPADTLAALQTRSPLQPDEPIVRAEVDAAGQAALRALGNAGFAFARIDLEHVPVAGNEVHLVIRASPGALAIFGPVDIAGNARVDDEVIRRELVHRPGERFSLRAMEESQLRLVLLGLFDEVHVGIPEPDAPPGAVRTQVTVVEGDHRDFELSVGYGSEQQLHTDVFLRHRNFFGGARTAAVRGRWSWLDRGVQAQFVEPYLIRRGLSFHAQGHYWSTNERWYDLLARGGRAAIEIRPMPRLMTRVGALNDFTSSRLADALRGDPGLSDTGAVADTADARQRGLLSAVTADAFWDATTGGLEPERGYAASLQVEQAGGWLPGSFDYIGIRGDVRVYGSRGPVTLAQRFRYGAISPFDSPADVPFFRRHFMGGAESLRGWGRLEVGPLSPAGVPLGGLSMFDATTEIRVPLVAAARGVVFLDAGNVWIDSWDFQPGDLLYAAGVGVRYASPFGPVRMDVGYQLTPIENLRIDGEPQTRRWRVHFGVSPTF